MGDWPLNHTAGPIESTGIGTASRGITVTASASTNTKGSATQLIASTAQEGAGLVVGLLSANAATTFMLDILIGSATEQVLIPNLFFARTGQVTADRVYIPVRIPRGSRISARVQAAVGSALMHGVMCQVIPASPTFPAAFGRCTGYGLTTASTTMTAVDAGGSADTKGSWTQLTASTTNPMKALIVGFGPGSDITTAANCQLLVDIGVGAATESVLIPNMALIRGTADDRPMPHFYGPFPVSVPAGSRITARAQCSVTTAGDRSIEVGVWGLD